MIGTPRDYGFKGRHWSRRPEEVAGHLLARPRGGQAKPCLNYEECRSKPYASCLRCGARFCEDSYYKCQEKAPPCEAKK